MNHQTFVLKLIDLQAQLNKAIYLIDYDNIELYSKKIGILINNFLNDNKINIQK